MDFERAVVIDRASLHSRGESKIGL